MIAPAAENRRRYLRLPSIFPVELHLPPDQVSGCVQGYTRNISEGGLCFEVHGLTAHMREFLQHSPEPVTLVIHIPLTALPTRVAATVAWCEHVAATDPEHYQLGLAFVDLSPAQRRRLTQHVRQLRWVPRVVATVSLCLLAATMGLVAWDLRLYRSQQALAARITSLQQREIALIGQRGVLERQHDALTRQMAQHRRRLAQLEVQAQQAAAASRVDPATGSASPARPDGSATAAVPADGEEGLAVQVLTTSLNKAQMAETLAQARQQHVQMQEVLANVMAGQAVLEEELAGVRSRTSMLEAEILDHLFTWLAFHQDPTTGLLVSFEGDPALADWAFTYDQSLFAQCLLLFGHEAAAARVLDFYRPRAGSGFNGFPNAYYASTGQVAEAVVHTGPTLWLGIAAVHYTARTHDERFVPLIRAVADWTMRLQAEDPDGGLRGGPYMTWYSTEHHLDAYAFFKMASVVLQEPVYDQAAERCWQWLQRYAHNAQEGRVNRGKGDATIATDTMAWAIAAVGADRLDREGWDPDRIIRFAEERCRVHATFGDGRRAAVPVTGFDFTAPQTVARGGVVSSEWTGQMVVTFKLLAQFHDRRRRVAQASAYERKARFYLTELEKLVITTPCKTGHRGWAVPYATQQNVDTGHGWRTANGASTGCASGSAYAIFARLGYNPLAIPSSEKEVR